MRVPPRLPPHIVAFVACLTLHGLLFSVAVFQGMCLFLIWLTLQSSLMVNSLSQTADQVTGHAFLVTLSVANVFVLISPALMVLSVVLQVVPASIRNRLSVTFGLPLPAAVKAPTGTRTDASDADAADPEVDTARSGDDIDASPGVFHPHHQFQRPQSSQPWSSSSKFIEMSTMKDDLAALNTVVVDAVLPETQCESCGAGIVYPRALSPADVPAQARCALCDGRR